MERVLSSLFAGSRVWSRSLRALSPSPSASVDLPHLSRRPAGVCAFCRISLEPEAEGDFPTASVGSSWGRRERDTLNHLFGIVRSYERRQERTSPGKRYTKDATTQSDGDPRWGGRRGGRRGHPSKSSRPPANRLDKTFASHGFVPMPAHLTSHIAHRKRLRIIDHFVAARAGAVGPGSGPPQSRR
jgi:hypothetical protein